MLEITFYVFGIAACGTYLVKEGASQILQAKERKKKRAIDRLMTEARRLQDKIEAHVDGLLPQIELAWDLLDKTGVRQIFSVEHEPSGNCTDHDACYQKYLKDVQGIYTAYVIELQVVPYQKQLDETRQQLGLMDFKSEFGHTADQVDELKKQLDTHGFDVKEIARQFS
jgi:hypothetical protein